MTRPQDIAIFAASSNGMTLLFFLNEDGATSREEVPLSPEMRAALAAWEQDAEGADDRS